MNSAILFSRPVTIGCSSFVDGSTRATGERELRAMIAYFDVPISSEMPWPLAMELHLFIPSPIVNVSKGNQYRDGEDEDFSTVHPVIVAKDEVVTGEPVVHVITRQGDFKNTAEFVVTTKRSADRSDLEFATTDECAGSCEERRCVNEICECKNAIGDKCQTWISIVTDCRETMCWCSRCRAGAQCCRQGTMVFVVHASQ
jgi:hypothetical protein